MPGLTVAERSHWRDRIAARIDKATDAIEAQHPALFDRLRREAHAEALRSLGLADAFAELEAVRAEETALARRGKAARRLLLATLRGVPLEDVGDPGGTRYGSDAELPMEVARAVERRQAAHRERLLAADPVGRELARLEAEKDRLLDTVWLATSPAQIKQLWAKVAELLGDEPTRLELEALLIPPPEED